MHVNYYYSVVIFVILCCVSIVSCYNVDTQRVISHRGPSDSMFGFTVAAHIERGSSMVLVGAPKAQTRQYGVKNGGAVYKCDTYSNNSCQQIHFDDTGDYSSSLGVIDQKSHQWFGSTLYSAGPEGPVVACAPRYVWFSSKNDRRDPVGTCYISRNNFTKFSEYSPCRTSQWGYHRQGSCQAGFSATISKDGNNVFIGAPGNCYWQGRMYSIDAHAKFPYKPPIGAPFGSGKVVRQSLHSRPLVFHTVDGSITDDDSYIGYSMTAIRFEGEVQEGIAVGMPRGGGLFGKILLYTWNLTNFMNITGRQMGSYFGYAVAAVDINGDKYDDLIIGAPLYTPVNNEGKYEIGKVYVVYQTSSMGKFLKLDELNGFKSKSRFGLSLASLGDINLDGYKDFAVGAPYDGTYERGAVYIFHGSAKGVQQKYAQVIYAEQVSRIPPSTFGFSLAGGIDLDRNDYPDTIIGAYLSDTIFFLRSRPVVKVTGYAQFQTANKEIALEDQQCTTNIQGKTVSVACTTIDTCLNYTGIGVPREITLQLKYTLDTQKKKNARMFFLDGNSNVWTGNWKLSKDSTSECSRKQVYIKRDIRDKLTPIDVEVTYSMDGVYYSYVELPPVLDLTSTSLKKDSITIRKNCGIDNVCIPDLGLEITPNVQRYLIASDGDLHFDITVSNNGEDSFETVFTIQKPSDVNYTKIADSGDVKVSCREHSENHTISCDIGNPLPAKKIVNFKMYFKPHYEEGMKNSYLFNAEVNSANPEDNSTLQNNKVKIDLPLWVNSKLELKGVSRPSEVYYNYTYYSNQEQLKYERVIGPQVIHLYTITNNGPSKINAAEILIFWPYATASGEDLMYLLEPPHALGNVRCERADFNYQDYLIEQRNKTIWESFDINVSKERNFTGKDVKNTDGDGIVIEQNKEKVSVSTHAEQSQTYTDDKNDDMFINATGDASEIYGKRVQGKGEQQFGGDGKTTIVTKSEHGAKTETITETFQNSSSGPGGTIYTYKQKTEITRGPHGEIIRNETSYDSQQNVLKRSKDHSTPDQQNTLQTNIDRNSIRIGNAEAVYSPPYSSVEFEVEQPDMQKINISSNNNHHQNQYNQQSHHEQYGNRHQGRHNTEHNQNLQYGRNQDYDNYYQSRQHEGGYSGTGQSSRAASYNKTFESNYAQPALSAAAIGHGSRTEFVDLEIPDRSNEHFLSKQGIDRNDYNTQSSKTYHKSRTYSRGKSGQNNLDEERNYEPSDESQGESHSESRWSQSRGQGYNLNIGVADEPPKNSIHERKRRQTDDVNDLTKLVKCKATNCKYLRCFLGPMDKDQDATIAIRTRINVKTLKNITSSKTITFSTMMVGKITSVPFIGIPLQKETVKYEIQTSVVPPEADTQPDEIVPLWVVVLSAIAGALILLLLIFLFYKCGFFKRNRPSNAPERQPLNRNGHSAGDEAL